MSKQVQNKFVAAVLKELNKSEQEKQLEAVQEFVESSVIECETQIALLKTAELPKAQQQLKKAQNQLAQAEKAFEKSRFSMATNFESYVANRESALDRIDEAKNAIAEAEQAIQNVQKRIAIFEEILADLS